MFEIDKEKIFWRRVGEETVILNIDTGFYYTLDEIGSVIWEKMLQNKELEQTAADIANIYDIDETTAKSDIKSLLKNLKKEDLVKTN